MIRFLAERSSANANLPLNASFLKEIYPTYVSDLNNSDYRTGVRVKQV